MIQNGAKDEYDERNYSYKEMVGSIDNTPLPAFYINESGEIQDQYKAGYPMGCVYFSTSEHDNFLNKINGVKEKSTGGELCKKSDTWSATDGDLIINGPKLAQKLGLISGYTQVNTIEEMIFSLYNGKNIHCGSNRIDWRKTNENKGIIVETSQGAGHCFHIIGYNKGGQIEYKGRKIPKNVFIIKDSSYYFDKGFFYIPFEKINLLFETKTNFINSKTLILLYKKEIMENIKIESAKKALEEGIWNGERPQEPITREEASAMIMRAMEKMKTM